MLEVRPPELNAGEVAVLRELNFQSDRGRRWLTPGDLTDATRLERRHVVAALRRGRELELVRAMRGRFALSTRGLELLAGLEP